MQYTILSVRPKEAQKKLNALAEQGWRVVSSSESAWVIKKCLGLSHVEDSIINIILVKD